MTTLKPHQITGADWLATKRYALLADQMRVGKTLTALKAAKIVGALRILIVCPAIARLNWAREVDISFGPVHTVATRTQLVHEELRFAQPGVTITSYDLIPTKEGGPWDLVILDESHFLRNGTAGRTRKVLARGGLVHRAERVWALSGTPAVKHAAELWCLLRAFGVYHKNYETFVREFCTSYYGPYGQVITGSKNHAALNALLSTVMLRRTLAEVAPELLPIEVTGYTLTGSTIPLPPREIALVAAAFASPDPEAALAELEPAVATLRRLTGLSKAPLAAELLRDELDAGGHKVVVFAVHREVVSLLAERLASFNPVIVNGAVAPVARNAAVARFQTDPACRVFIGNIQSAGTAIDLSAASECVFVESSWVPGDNEQAAMRLQNLERTGQVTARFLSLGGTIDERIQRVCVARAADLTAIFDG